MATIDNFKTNNAPSENCSASKAVLSEFVKASCTNAKSCCKTSYQGQIFEYLGPWAEGKKYYSDEYRLSFVSFENTFLVCNKSHTSSSNLKPIIETDGTGKPVSVKNTYWDVVLYGINSTPEVDQLEKAVKEIQEQIKTIQTNVSSLEDITEEISKTVISNTQNIDAVKKQTQYIAKTVDSLSKKIDEISKPWIGFIYSNPLANDYYCFTSRDTYNEWVEAGSDPDSSLIVWKSDEVKNNWTDFNTEKPMAKSRISVFTTINKK